jgi:5S rRNA maturation endonuclease (ribonuclease M5)
MVKKMCSSYLSDVKKIPRNIWEAEEIQDDGKKIRVPIYYQNGELAFVRERYVDKDNVFLQASGCELYPWGLNKLNGNSKAFIVEGETDRLTMLLLNFENVVALPGGGSWKSEWTKYFKLFSVVYIIGDNDDTGEKMASRIRIDLPNSKIVNIPSYVKDINELWTKYQDISKVKTIINEAIALSDGKLLPPLKGSFLDLYIDYCTNFTDAPREFHHFIGYSIISTAISNKVYFNWGDKRVYTNLWMVLLAPSSQFRKSWSIGIGENILAAALDSFAYPNEFSHESLLQNLQSQPCGIYIHKEFSSLLELLNKDYMHGCKGVLAELYDCPPVYKRKTNSTDIKIENPCIGMLSATNITWFLDSIREQDFKGGFLARILFIPVQKKERTLSWPPLANIEKKEALSYKLREISKLEGMIIFSSGVKSLYDNWYRKFEKRILSLDDLIQANLSRLMMYVLKIAVLEQISVSYNPLEALNVGIEPMERAINVVSWLADRLEELIGNEVTFTWFDKNKKKVLDLIRKNQDGIQRQDLTWHSHLKAKELNEIIDTLIQEESIIVKKRERAVVYYLKS